MARELKALTNEEIYERLTAWIESDVFRGLQGIALAHGWQAPQEFAEAAGSLWAEVKHRAAGPCPNCGGRAGEAEECPYGVEIAHDHTPCRCCDGCKRACARDI